MNEHFVNVKVDREERPDVDAVYMEAVQAMTGHGGWPMTAFLTPAGEPFFCGTYFPPAARPRHAGVPRGARRRSRRPGRPGAARWSRPAARGRRAGCPAAPTARRRTVTPELLDEAARRAAPRVRRGARRLRRRAEVPAVDGAGVPAAARTRAPAARTSGWSSTPAGRWRAAACTTSSPAGSPATPSTPPGWCRTSRRCCTTTRCCCASTCTCGGRPARELARRVARETAEFLLRDLRTPEGGFA